MCVCVCDVGDCGVYVFVLLTLVLRDLLVALVVDNDRLHMARLFRDVPVLARSDELLDERRSSPVVDVQGARCLPWQMLGEDVFLLVIDLLAREVESVTVANVNVTGAVIVPVQKEAEAQRGADPPVTVVGLIMMLALGFSRRLVWSLAKRPNSEASST